MQARAKRSRTPRGAAAVAVAAPQATCPEVSTDEGLLTAARELVAHLEAGNSAEAMRLLHELTRVQESAVYLEMGRLTRQLHDALARLDLDDQLLDLTAQEIPEAKERLAYVVSLTEQAANQTLTAVEESLPTTVGLKDEAVALAEAWGRFTRGELGAPELRAVADAVGEFLGRVARESEQLHAKLSEVLMAQGFQDLTGQVLRRVTGLVQEVENSLVNIIRLSDPRLPGAAGATPPAPPATTGPSIGRTGQAEVVAGQDEVDALLSSLGF